MPRNSRATFDDIFVGGENIFENLKPFVVRISKIFADNSKPPVCSPRTSDRQTLIGQRFDDVVNKFQRSVTIVCGRAGIAVMGED